MAPASKQVTSSPKQKSITRSQQSNQNQSSVAPSPTPESSKGPPSAADSPSTSQSSAASFNERLTNQPVRKLPIVTPEQNEAWQKLRGMAKETVTFYDYYLKLLQRHFLEPTKSRVLRMDEMQRRRDICAPALQLQKHCADWWSRDADLDEFIRVKKRPKDDTKMVSVALVSIYHRFGKIIKMMERVQKEALAKMVEFFDNKSNRKFASVCQWNSAWEEMDKVIALLSDVWQLPAWKQFTEESFQPPSTNQLFGRVNDKTDIIIKLRRFEGRCNLTSAILSVLSSSLVQMIQSACSSDTFSLNSAMTALQHFDERLPRMYGFAEYDGINEQLLTMLQSRCAPFKQHMHKTLKSQLPQQPKKS